MTTKKKATERFFEVALRLDRQLKAEVVKAARALARAEAKFDRTGNIRWHSPEENAAAKKVWDDLDDEHHQLSEAWDFMWSVVNVLAPNGHPDGNSADPNPVVEPARKPAAAKKAGGRA